MAALKCSFFFFFLLLLINIQSNNETNDLLRKSVGFSYFLTDGFSNSLSSSNRTHFWKELTTLSPMHSFAKKDYFLIVKSVSFNFIGYMICISFGILFIILMPICGLCLCCCRCCCNRCKAKTEFVYEKNDKTKLGIYSVLLLIIATIQLIAIIVAFINLHLSHQAIVSEQNSFTELKNGIHGVNASINKMIDAAKSKTIASEITEEKDKFFDTVNRRLDQLMSDLMKNDKVNKFIQPSKELFKIIDQYKPESLNANETEQEYTKLKNYKGIVDHLNEKILDKLNSCPNVDKIRECNDMKTVTKEKMVSQINVQNKNIMDYLKIIEEHPSFISRLQNIDQFWSSIDIKSRLKEPLEDAWKALSSNEEYQKKLQNIFDEIYFTTKKYTEQMSDYIFKVKIRYSDHDFIRFYVMIGVLSIPLWIIFLIFLGLCFGTCGNRPYPDSGACNKGAGANLLLAALGFIFIFSSLLMIICLSHFSIGSIIQSEGCRYFDVSQGNASTPLDEFYKFTVNKSVYGEYRETLSSLRPIELVWHKCESKSFTESLGDIKIKNIDEAIEDQLKKIKDKLEKIDISSPVVEEIDKILNEFGQFDNLKTFDFTPTIIELDKPTTGLVNVEKYLSRLESIGVEDLAQEFREKILPLDESKEKLKSHLLISQEALQYFKTSSDELKNFKNNANEILNNIFKREVDSLDPELFLQLRGAVMAMYQFIKCDDLNTSARRMSNAFCKKFLQPFNGIWSGLGFTLILFIPSIFLIIGLVSIYRKTEEYNDAFAEQNYSDLENFISFKGYYVSPKDTSETNNGGKKKKKNNVARTNNGYAPVSVYPYDAYE